MIRANLEDGIRSALGAIGSDATFVVERPGQMEHGDYSTNAALAAAKTLEKNPREVASELASKLSGIEGIEKVEVAGAGFINFFLTREEIKKEVSSAATEKEWGSNALYKNKKVLVEYTSPNLFKPLHIGNLVGNILGEAVARLLEGAGADVKRLNYPSDIGLTVAKAVWGLQKLGLDAHDIAALGRAYVAGTEAYEGSAKPEIEAINKALYEGSDETLSALRAAGIETSRKHLGELCARLGTTFDQEFFESQSGPIGRELVQINLGKIFEESEGAVIYKGEQDGLHTRVFLNSQGLPTYEAKDLGLLSLKLENYPDFNISITDTGPEQTEYFKVLYTVARKVFPKLEGRSLQHIAHGYLKLTTGKMASRTGNVITGESLLQDLQEVAKEKMEDRELSDKEKTADQIAVGAIKYAVLKQGNGRDIMFDPEKSLSLEGDSGPYLQYARVRALSLMKEARKQTIEAEDSDAPEHAHMLERLLVHFPDAVARAAKELEPHYVTTYLTELASTFNSWYASGRVIGGSNPHYGILLTTAVEQTLAKGFRALGIPSPEEM